MLLCTIPSKYTTKRRSGGFSSLAKLFGTLEFYFRDCLANKWLETDTGITDLIQQPEPQQPALKGIRCTLLLHVSNQLWNETIRRPPISAAFLLLCWNLSSLPWLLPLKFLSVLVKEGLTRRTHCSVRVNRFHTLRVRQERAFSWIHCTRYNVISGEGKVGAYSSYHHLRSSKETSALWHCELIIIMRFASSKVRLLKDRIKVP